MQKNRRFLLVVCSFYVLIILGIIVFHLINPFRNECVWGDCTNGKGVYIYGSGIQYDGEWRNGKKHGKGKLTYPDGSRYEGEWKDDRMNGYGMKFYTSDYLHIKYSGEWENGKKHGKGTQTYIAGEIYEGEWKNGEWYGHGSYTTADGKKFEGKRKEGILYGHGSLTYSDGTKIAGKWVNNMMEGDLEFYYFEFEKEGYDIAELVSAIKSDIRLSVKAAENTAGWLNELLKIPNLYEQLNVKLHKKNMSMKIIALVENTKNIRNRRFSELPSAKKEDIKKLNRLLIEHVYPEKTPKLKW